MSSGWGPELDLRANPR